MTDKAGLSLPLTGAIKEVVKEARRVKASNPPNWTGNKPLKYAKGFTSSAYFERAQRARVSRSCSVCHPSILVDDFITTKSLQDRNTL